MNVKKQSRVSIRKVDDSIEDVKEHAHAEHHDRPINSKGISSAWH
jgi:hypothetical protein